VSKGLPAISDADQAFLTRQWLSPMGKRAFDLLFALVALVLLSPIFVLIAFLIKADSAGPILFRQERVGLGGTPFRVRKFRTMHLNAEERGTITAYNDPRVTRVGRFLRRYKVDELPQLIDVMLGFMSVVGPRPEVREYFLLYPPDAQLAMISIRPGITGPSVWMSLNEGEVLRLSLDPNETYASELIPIKAHYIVEYAAHTSLLRDLGIMLCTLRKLFSGRL
jgi:lipopolysaccharide/colanic/teichoic acid biosynthesis glycosyltransferase